MELVNKLVLSKWIISLGHIGGNKSPVANQESRQLPMAHLSNQGRPINDITNPLVNVHITMENHRFQWVNQLSMGNFQ